MQGSTAIDSDVAPKGSPGQRFSRTSRLEEATMCSVHLTSSFGHPAFSVASLRIQPLRQGHGVAAWSNEIKMLHKRKKGGHGGTAMSMNAIRCMREPTWSKA
eukprot:scaffold307580_cov40-Tisochrysis_lutea.AAC.1